MGIPSRKKYQYSIWGEDSREHFLKSLEENVEELKKVEGMDVRESENLLSSFTKTVSEIADKAKLKVKKQKKGRKKGFVWFDDECIKAKKDLNALSRELQLNPKSVDLRQKCFFQNKKYRNTIRTKKRQHRNQVMSDLAINRNDGKKFWKLLDKLKAEDQNEIFIERMGAQKLKTSFESILRDKNNPVCPPDSKENGPLDNEITMEELKSASYILKPGKSTGPDPISYEMLDCIIEKQPGLLLKLFNSILLYNGKTPGWYKSILILLYKKGSKTEPLNYRGISLLSCVSKLFTAVLNKRLLAYCIEHKILKPNQLGFVPGNRCSDAHLIIQYLIQKHCHRQGKKLYGCFVDFSKAFDTISREKLFEKLLKHGINGNFYNVLKNIYFNDETRIKVGDHLSDVIYPNQGVRQGCILSPLLFNIYLSDLPQRIENADKNALMINGKVFNSIIWADDLIMFSESEDGLNDLLKELSVFTEENNMTVNIDKTKAMIFNKTGKFMKRNFIYKNSKIETVREYKYLGFLLVPSGSIVPGLHDLKSRSNRALFKIKNKMGEHFRTNPSITIKLFNTLVRPILTYMSELWGCLKMPKNDPISNFQMSFLKEILGVNIKTTNTGVLLETGEIPINLLAKKLCIKNWVRIKKGHANMPLIDSTKESQNDNHPWSEQIRTEFFSNGLGGLFSQVKTTKTNVCSAYFKRKLDIFYQSAFSQLNDQNSKLRTYGLLKKESGFENYLNNLSVRDRTAFTRLRLSNHSLMIEKMRHQFPKPPETDRRCPFCPNFVENEIHFLLVCPTFSIHRENLISLATRTIPNFRTLNDNEKFLVLMTENSIIKETAKYLKTTFEVREFLTRPHKCNG